MKKNIIIVLLSVLLILSIAFGYYQKTEADKFEALAIENGKIAREASINAEKQMKLAEEQRAMAVMSMAEAVKQREIAQENLEKMKRAK